MKISPHILETKELAVASQQCTISYFIFNQRFFDQNNKTVIPHPPYFSLITRLKIKLKGHHFDIIEVIKAESREVLMTLTEHDIQHEF
jgi:hypothetical protein